MGQKLSYGADFARENMASTMLNELAYAFPQWVESSGALDLAKLSAALNDFNYFDNDFTKISLLSDAERYELLWGQKAQTKQELKRETDQTLAPLAWTAEQSNKTANIVVQGAPVTALKVLQRSILGMGGLKLAYCEIEPQDLDRSYLMLSLIRPLLRDDGCCLVLCPDASALAYQRKICDEVFGANNFIATFVWQPDQQAALKYILLYARANYDFNIGRLPRTAEANKRYKNPDNDPRGPWQSSDVSVKTYSPSCDYAITTPSGRIVNPPAGSCWRLSKESFERYVADNRIWFGADGNNTPRIKRFLSELKNDGMVPTSILLPTEMGALSAEQAQVGNPKLTITAGLAQRLLTLANLAARADSFLSSNDAVLLLGVVSGCAQMATALTALKQERGAHYRFIWVGDDDALTWLNDLHRVRGFEVPPLRRFKLEADAKKQYLLPLNAYSQDMLSLLLTPEETDSAVTEAHSEERRWERALYQLCAYLVRSGMDLTLSIERRELCHGERVYQLLNYAHNQLWFCADSALDMGLIYAVAAVPLTERPQRLLCVDESFSSDSAKINCSEHATMLLGPDVLTLV